MTYPEMFKDLLDDVSGILERNARTGDGAIRSADFEGDVPGVDDADFKVVFYASNPTFGDSYSGIILCCSPGSPDGRGDTLSVSLVSVADMKNPGANYRILMDGVVVDHSSKGMMSALLQYVFADFFFKHGRKGISI